MEGTLRYEDLRVLICRTRWNWRQHTGPWRSVSSLLGVSSDQGIKIWVYQIRIILTSVFFLAGLQDNERNSPSVLFVLSFDWAHRTKSIWSNDFLLRPATPSHLTVGLGGHESWGAVGHQLQPTAMDSALAMHWRCIGDSWSGCHGAKPPVASSLGKVLRKLCRPGLSSGHITPGVQRLVFILFQG